MTDWQLDEFTDKDVVFIGQGKGRAMAGVQEFLERHGAIRSFIGVDQASAADPWAFLSERAKDQTVFIKNEGVPGHLLPVDYLTPLQLFFRLVSQTGATTVGITGTKGKSTTASLTHHALQTAGKHAVLAGNIGTSPLTLLDGAGPETIFVLELSSYQLQDLSVSPHISACINLFNDHSDWHGSIDRYWEAKHNIMRFAGAGDTFIYNPQFPTMVRWAEDASCQTSAIDPAAPLDMSQSRLYGDHNRLNALVVREIVRRFDVSDEQFLAALNSFEPLRHRMQLVAEKLGHIFIDDAIGMTPESTLASMAAVTDKYGPIGCLLLGGQDRGYDFTTLLQQIADYAIPNLVLFPDTADTMRQLLPDGYAPQIFQTADMAAAVQFASEQAPAGSVVLLSTGAPSYSVWKDFEDKGDRFQAAVSAL